MTRRSFPFLLLLVVGLVATSCTVGPNYQRPDAPIPEAYRGASPRVRRRRRPWAPSPTLPGGSSLGIRTSRR